VKREDGTATRKALALSVDCNPRFCWLDPRSGTIAAVAEAARNVACTGARPLALTNCLNFGNPEKPEIMWQLREAIAGLGEAARALGTPVVSGNVSLYNETHGTPIHPTPTVAMVGLLEPWENHAVSHFTDAGYAIVLLGESREELGGSAWLALRRGLEAGLPPRVDLEHEKRLHRLLERAVKQGLLVTAHDVSAGGLALALAECCLTGGSDVGAEVELTDRIRPDALLFGESTGRVIAAASDAEPILQAARQEGVPARVVGRTGGSRLRIAGAGGTWIDEPVAALRAIFERAIPRRLNDGGTGEGEGRPS
jgi:phosphoribosylformylglycinamidine synthase subunit PurL